MMHGSIQPTCVKAEFTRDKTNNTKDEDEQLKVLTVFGFGFINLVQGPSIKVLCSIRL
jgi:hypothetical protein